MAVSAKIWAHGLITCFAVDLQVQLEWSLPWRPKFAGLPEKQLPFFLPNPLFFHPFTYSPVSKNFLGKRPLYRLLFVQIFQGFK